MATPRPAELLEGKVLPNGWTVGKMLTRPLNATGGHFSVGYTVSHTSKPNGFLKAMDYSDALGALDPALALNALTNAYIFERDLCTRCATSSMDHVVTALDHGSCLVIAGDPLGTVQYIIFERAEGDIRQTLDQLAAIDDAFRLRVLHNVAVGLRQLHTSSVAHQDLKPSNVLQFPNSTSKVGDLGRASIKQTATPSPTDSLELPGDRAYAPPEMHYKHVPPDWMERRIGCDLFLFGSFTLFMFTRLNMSAELFTRLKPEFHPANWVGSFAEVLPFLNNALADSLEEIRPSFPEAVRDELIDMVRQLCNPDPKLRGHPGENRHGNSRYSLERYVAKLDHLSTKASILASRGR
jgi:serine/threonine protein kinase